MIIQVGVSRWRQQQIWNLNSVPHSKIAGVTGSGKTAFFETILYEAAANNTPDRCVFIIIDLKGGASFAHFATLPHVLGIYADIKQAEIALALCHLEMNNRLQEIRAQRAVFRTIPNFPHVLIVIDEGGEMSPELGIDKEDKQQRARIYKHISSLARIGRECHMHVLFGTQQPNAETLPTNIRGQLEATFCFRVENDIDSEIVLRHKGAEKLPHIPGRCIYKTPIFGEIEMQTLYVKRDVLQRFIQGYKVDTPACSFMDIPGGDSPDLSGIDFTDEIED